MDALLLALRRSKTIIFGIDSIQYLNLIPHVSLALLSRQGIVLPTSLKVGFDFITQIAHIGIPLLRK